MPNWEEIKKEFETSDISLKALADKHGVKLGTLKSRRSREKWQRDATVGGKDATSSKGVATANKKVSTSKPKKQNRGNPNPVRKFTKRNQAARKHGLFSKYLPKETRKLAEKMNDIAPEDILWQQITLQYASILRAQKIMFVENSEDHTQFMKKEMKVESYVDENNVSVDKWVIEYDNIGAWEKQSSFMASMTRAIGELRNLIKQYVAIADEADERRLKLELMRSSIDKTNVEISRLKGDDLIEYEDDGFEDALLGIEEVWND